MATVKEKRTRSYIWLAILIGILVIAVGIWSAFFRNRTFSSDATAYVDGRIETNGNEIDKAMEGFYSTEPADVIQSDPKAEESTVGLLFVGTTEEKVNNEKLLEMLQSSGIKASFALSSADSLENEEFAQELLENGYEVISNGSSGEGNIHNKTPREMVETMLRSREKLSTALDTEIPYIYCSSTNITNDVLTAASVSGYQAIVDSNGDYVLDASSFADSSDAEEYVQNLNGSTVLVVNIRGLTEEILDEESIVAQKPAVDLQAGLDDTKEEETEENPDLLTQIQWLLEALKDQKAECKYISELDATDGIQVLKHMTEDTQAEKAAVYHSCLTDQKVIGVGMEGIPDASNIDQVLEMLKNENMTITFFVTSDEVKDREEDIHQLLDAGCSVGGVGKESSDSASAMDIFDEMDGEIQGLGAYEQTGARLYLTKESEVSDAVRVAAKLLNVRIVSPQNPKKPEAGALYLVNDIDEAVQLKAQAEKMELSVSDIQSVVDGSGTIPVLSAKEISTMRKENNHELSEMQENVQTTERAFSFVFYGLNHDSATEDAADEITAQNGKATFFITLSELMAHQTAIEHIIEEGHEIGISYRVSADYPQTFDAVINYLNSWKAYAKWRYGIDASVVFMPSDTAEEETEEAVHVSGCELVGSTFRVVKNDDKNITKADISKVMSKIENMRLQRGAFVCFNMEFYENDRYTGAGDSIFGDMLKAFVKEHVDTLAYTSYETGEIEDASRFTYDTVTELLASDEKYTLSDTKQDDVTLSKNVLTNMKTEEERTDYITDHYIGTASVDKSNRLPGFTDEEIKKLDKTGRFTDDKVLFLTFDDWGTEKSLNELLYVLEKHDVKGTFFVKTEYVDSNPNLLRTIAVQGHQIASHTDGHIPLTDSMDEDENTEVSLTENEALNLREDVVTSYNKLYKYTGDVEVDGKPALTRMFRPPTLAVSKIGISQIFDVGYEYSISGELSTGDYEAGSYEDMLQRIQKRSLGGGNFAEIQNGCVIVMHMQETAKYTAQVLDTMIPIWKEEGYRFARIDEYLGE